MNENDNGQKRMTTDMGSKEPLIIQEERIKRDGVDTIRDDDERKRREERRRQQMMADDD